MIVLKGEAIDIPSLSRKVHDLNYIDLLIG